MAYNESLKLKPNNAKVLCRLGNVYFLKEEYSKAKEIYEKAIDVGQDDSTAMADSCFGLGYICFRKEEIGKAIQLYKKAVKYDPKDAMAFLALAEAYHRGNNLQEARKNFKIAQDLAAKDQTTKKDECFQKLSEKLAYSLNVSKALSSTNPGATN